LDDCQTKILGFVCELGKSLRGENASTVEVNAGSLDDCENVHPRYHIWCRSRIKWFDTDYGPPRFDEEKPKDFAP
jgi:hypothetical protein